MTMSALFDHIGIWLKQRMSALHLLVSVKQIFQLTKNQMQVVKAAKKLDFFLESTL